VTIEGAGGPITLPPVRGDPRLIDALGFRIGDLAYLPDVSDIPPETAWPLLEGLDCWVLDALRRTPHPSHAHLEKSLNGSRGRRRGARC
jgi:phosphoribosyl 1,2-cyclic phosphate phosphodiesterase